MLNVITIVTFLNKIENVFYLSMKKGVTGRNKINTPT